MDKKAKKKEAKNLKYILTKKKSDSIIILLKV